MKETIGIIGAGNMGEAFIGAVLSAKLFESSEILVSDVDEGRLRFMEKTYAVRTTSDNAALFDACAIAILAIKPQQMNDILTQISPGSGNGPTVKKLVISIAAGIRIEKMEAILYAALPEEKRAMLPIIRVMPNTPALVLKGVSGMSANRHATSEDIQSARSILSAMGTVLVFDESGLDAVTAISGSGPAYAFFLAEAMMDAGIGLGLTTEEARELTIGTIKGAMALMEDRGESPEALRKKVTSPGGTTEAAFKVLDANKTKEVIISAIGAAADRSRELSR